MAVNNTLNKGKTANAAIVEYESGGQMVKLSPAMIKQYLVSGDGNVTDQEVMMFLSLCKFQKLNPFLREAHLIKYGSSAATMVVGKDVFTKRARRNPDYAGKQAGIIVQVRETGEVIEREGTYYIKAEENLVGGWAKVFIKGYAKPEYVAVSFDEYAGRKSNGELNKQWASKPATMIRKVALVQALREAFPEDFSGMNSPEEIQAANEVLDNAAANEPVPVPAVAEEIPAPPPEMTVPAADVQAALFG